MLKYLLVLVAGLTAISGCQAQDSTSPAPAAPKRQWEAGKDYQLINPAVPPAGDKVVVTEVFSYACPHCAHFQPYADDLKAKPPAGAVRIAAGGFNPAGTFARASTRRIAGAARQDAPGSVRRGAPRSVTAAHARGLGQPVLHELRRQSGQLSLSTATSFVIEGEMAQAIQLVRDYGVEATPTLIVNGKYRVSMNLNVASAAGSGADRRRSGQAGSGGEEIVVCALRQ